MDEFKAFILTVGAFMIFIGTVVYITESNKHECIMKLTADGIYSADEITKICKGN